MSENKKGENYDVGKDLASRIEKVEHLNELLRNNREMQKLRDKVNI